jgi:hypothetical protein
MPKQAKRPTRREKIEKTKENVVQLKQVEQTKQEEVQMPEVKENTEAQKTEPESNPGFFSRHKWLVTGTVATLAIIGGIAYALLSGDSESSDSTTSGDQV